MLLPINEYGLKPLCVGLFHHNATVRDKATVLISKIKEHKYGQFHVNKLNGFILLTYQRLSREYLSNPVEAPPAMKSIRTPIIVPNITANSTTSNVLSFTFDKFPASVAVHHLVDSTTTLASQQSLDSYMSFSFATLPPSLAQSTDVLNQPRPQMVARSDSPGRANIRFTLGSEPNLNTNTKSTNNVNAAINAKVQSSDSLPGSAPNSPSNRQKGNKIVKKGKQKAASNGSLNAGPLPIGSRSNISHVQRGSQEPRSSMQDLNNNFDSEGSDVGKKSGAAE